METWRKEANIKFDAQLLDDNRWKRRYTNTMKSDQDLIILNLSKAELDWMETWRKEANIKFDTQFLDTRLKRSNKGNSWLKE